MDKKDEKIIVEAFANNDDKVKEMKEKLEEIKVSFRKLDNGEIVTVKRKKKRVVSREERKRMNKIRKKLKK